MQAKIHGGGGARDLIHNSLVFIRGPHNPAFPDTSSTDFELRLDESNHIRARLEQRFDHRQNKL
jgi:hypothetical protein